MSPLLGGIFFIVLALGAGCVGFFVPRLIRLNAPVSGDQQGRRWTPIEARAWLFAWVMMGLGLAGIATSTLRYGRGQYVIVPATAPPIDRAIWVGSFVCAFAGLAVCVAWILVESILQMRTRRQNPGGS